MSTIADLVIKLRADTGVAEKDITSFGSKVGSGLKKGFVPAIAAMGALGVAAKIGFGELADAEKVTAQTNAVLKSTGGIANVTAAGLDGLANSLLKKSGVDDEAIKSGANLLLTFTNIRNEAGKGNDIFNQATSTMLDMSTALGQDMKSSAIQLGKALNNPIKGMTALQRVGVSFTEDQKKQVKALVESGRTMDAQKLILAELNKEFGGSAAAAGKTFSGQMNIAKEEAKNFAAELVSGALPMLTGLASGLQKATEWAQKHQDVVKTLIGVVAGVSGVIIAANIAMKAWAAATALARAATAAWTAVQWLLNAALTANPIGIVVVALGALVAAIIVAWQKSETFRDIVLGAWNAIKAATLAVWDFIKDYIIKWWPLILGVVTFGMAPIVKFLFDHWTEIKNTVVSIWNWVLGFIKQWWPLLLASVTFGMSLVVKFLFDHWTEIKNTAVTIWNALKTGVMAVVNALKTALETVFGAIKTSVEFYVNSYKVAATTAFNAMKTAVTTVMGAIKTAVSTVWGAVVGIVKTAAGILSGAVGGIVGTFQRVIDILRGIVSAAKEAFGWIGKVLGKAKDIGGGIVGFGKKLWPFASGTDFAPGGLSLVGEQGPELVNLPRGAKVFNNKETRGMLGSGGPSFTIQGDLVVREEADADRIAAKIGRRLAVAGI